MLNRNRNIGRKNHSLIVSPNRSALPTLGKYLNVRHQGHTSNMADGEGPFGMLLYGCFSGPLTQYFKPFPLSFPQIRCFCVCSFNANEEERGGFRRRVGVWP